MCADDSPDPPKLQRFGSVITDVEVIVAVCGFAVGGNAMASRKVDSNALIGLQGCQDLWWGKTLKGDR